MSTASVRVFAGKNLETAFQKTARAWFPVNPAVVDRVLSRVASGYYTEKQDALVEDLKSDCSLFLYCLKDLKHILQIVREPERGEAAAENSVKGEKSSINEKVLASIEHLLRRENRKISAHRIDEMTPIQAARLRDSLLSACTVETLAEKFSLSPKAGFACALLRQLGLTLIAWNYPHVYERALEALREFEHTSDDDVDAFIHGSLGFSPTMLGVKFAQSWELPAEIISVVRSSGSGKSAESWLSGRKRARSDDKGLMATLCSVGEMFARANNPEHYPSARDEWEAAEKVIRRQLGPEGVRVIHEKARVLSEHYAAVSPEEFELEDIGDSVPLLRASQHGQMLFERNVYLKACPPDVRSCIAEMYADLEPGEVSDELIGCLLREVVPSLGFDCCVVFTLDPASAALVPVLKFGKPAFIRLRHYSLIEALGLSGIISESYSRAVPMCETGVLRDGTRKTIVAGAFGGKRRVGVLYLEKMHAENDEAQKDPIILFKAVTTCVNDFMWLV